MSGKGVTALVYAASAREGGGQTYLTQLLRRVPADTIRVRVVAPHSILAQLRELPITPHPAPRVIESPVLRVAWERISFPGLLRRSGATVLFCPGGIVPNRIPPDTPVVTMFRNMLPFMPDEIARFGTTPVGMRLRLLRRPLLRSMYRADKLIVLSRYARDTVEPLLPSSRPQLVTIPHGIDARFRANGMAADSRPAWLPDRPYLLYVSIFEPYKRQIEVLEAYERFARLVAEPPSLVLVGRTSTAYGRLALKRANTLVAKDRVMFAGARPYVELAGAYRHAAINIFASTCENCPNILLEMLAAGRPIIASMRPPMPEIAGDAALYFEPDDPGQLAKLIPTVLGDRSLAEHLAGKAASRSRDFDWDDTARRTWQTIVDAANEGALAA